MLEATNIHYRVNDRQIIDGVSAAFPTGSFSMILGPNGSGKSTLLKIICGEIARFEGEVTYDDVSIRQLKKDEMARSRAVMSQQPELNFPLSVEEVVMMGRYPHFAFKPSTIDHEICNTVMRDLGLIPFRTRDYLTLSGGEKQRVHFARALAQVWAAADGRSRYLLLDEPLTSLDVNYQYEFLQIARNLLNESTTLIAILHDINLAIEFADHLFFLKEGRIVGSGPVKSILDATLIETVFGVPAVMASNPVTGMPLVIFRRMGQVPPEGRSLANS